MDFAIAAAAIIGLVNGFRLAQQKDKTSFIYFLIGIGAGLAFGALHWFGLPGLEAGFTAALSASGLYRVGQKIGGE